MDSILSRYLNAEVLASIAHRPLEPQSLVVGNLAGAHKSPLSGFAVEFAGHREYVPGDDPRHLDWRIYYTREKYFVKQYELETNFVCHLTVDASASMRYGEAAEQKLLYAARMAATLAYSIVRQSDKVSLSVFDDQVRDFVPPSNHLDQLIRLTQHLDQIQPVEKTDLGRCLAELDSRWGRREIAMIFSDFFGDLDSLEEALQRLRYKHHEVVLFQVLHHDELEFEFDGPVRFLGLEDDDDLLANPADLRAAYLAEIQKFNADLEELAQRNGCEYVQIDTRRNMAEVFGDYLNHRSRHRRSR